MRGTRYHIAVDAADGLVYAGEPGVQLTGMDAKVGDWVVTPRIGKPVEVQALWLAALHAAAPRSSRWGALYELGRDSFARRFWNEQAGCLYDVVDAGGLAGAVDASFRPNQILALGACRITRSIPAGARCRCRRVAPVDAARPALARARRGGVRWALRRRCTRAHGGLPSGNGVAVAGPFVEAWVGALGSTGEARKSARQRFIQPLEQHLADAGLGHVSEIADGDAPHEPRGCPFQAWSVGEVLRLLRGVLAPS